ncbi:MAG: DinB family protein [Bacteroidetes bacterium]|nr:DinB family protein [Bacteroidota bacterium]
MKNLTDWIPEIQNFIETTFRQIDYWFDMAEPCRQYKPLNGGWSIDQILEHISLTNHFLLILILKATKKSLEKKASTLDWQQEVTNYSFQLEKLQQIGIHKSFCWMRPEHMEPKGDITLVEVRQKLKEQLHQCLQVLDQLKNGEGALHKTTMTVNSLGKMDVYEYLYFLAQHGQRHVTQMENNRTEFESLG